MKEEYDFSDLEEIMAAIEKHVLEERDSKNMTDVKNAIDKFLESRTNSELIDLPDLDDGWWDLDEHWIRDSFNRLVDRRNIPLASQVKAILNMWHPEWASSDSERTRFEKMEKRVVGIQKKLDKMFLLIKDHKVELTVEDALKL